MFGVETYIHILLPFIDFVLRDIYLRKCASLKIFFVVVPFVVFIYFYFFIKPWQDCAKLVKFNVVITTFFYELCLSKLGVCQ